MKIVERMVSAVSFGDASPNAPKQYIGDAMLTPKELAFVFQTEAPF